MISNSSSQYTSLAAYYDKLNSHVPYEQWAEFLHRTVSEFGNGTENIWLDLGCGTGAITLPLSRLGHEMIGIDISPDMLMIARDRACDAGENILWLCQDMRKFELYGTVDAIVCCLDSLNYLPSRQGLEACFRLVNNYLGPGGIFIFDVNTPYKFKNIYGNNDYILEADGVFCGWHNEYDAHHGSCTFDLTIFAENEDGSYDRFHEIQREYCYSDAVLRDCIAKSGLEIIDVWSDFDRSPASEQDERWFYICRGSGKEGL